MKFFKALWLSLTFSALAAVAAQAEHNGLPGTSPFGRDFYRLDRAEQDFLQADRDVINSPYGSYQREIAIRNRDRANQIALDEAREVLVLRATGQHGESLERLRRYNRSLEQSSYQSAGRELYRGLTQSAGEGLVEDVRILGQRAPFNLNERAFNEVEQVHGGTSYGSLLRDLTRRALDELLIGSASALERDLRFMPSFERMDLERRLAREADLASYGSLRRDFYRRMLEVASHGGGGGPHPTPYPTAYPTPFPEPVGLRVFLQTSDGGSKEINQNQTLVMVKGSSGRIQAIVQMSDGSGQVVPAQVRPIQVEEALRLSGQGPSTTLSAVKATINAPLSRLEVRAQGRFVEFSVRVVLPPPRPMSQDEAVRSVGQAYRGILGREVDPEGQNIYVGLVLREGWRGWGKVLEALANSPEFQQNVLPKGPAQVVEQMFGGLLQRNAGHEGHAAYDGQIASGQSARAAVAIGTSEEFRERMLGH